MRFHIKDRIPINQGILVNMESLSKLDTKYFACDDSKLKRKEEFYIIKRNNQQGRSKGILTMQGGLKGEEKICPPL